MAGRESEGELDRHPSSLSRRGRAPRVSMKSGRCSRATPSDFWTSIFRKPVATHAYRCSNSIASSSTRSWRETLRRWRPSASRSRAVSWARGAFGGLVRLAGGRLSLRVYSAAYRLYWTPGRVRFATRDGEYESMVLEGLHLPRYMCLHGFTGYVRGLLRLANDARDVRHACAHVDPRLEQCAWVVEPTRG